MTALTKPSNIAHFVRWTRYRSPFMAALCKPVYNFNLKNETEMEISIAILFIAGVIFLSLFQNLSELHRKIEILMQNTEINWEQYFTSEIRGKIEKNELAKAAGMLRQETGLSLKQCLAIVERMQDKNA